MLPIDINNFVIPVGVLLKLLMSGPVGTQFEPVYGTILASLGLAASAAVIIVLLSSLIVIAATYRGGVFVRQLAVAASTGYAIPGTMLSIGVLIFAGLTAYDTQKIKNTYLEMAAHGDKEWLGKAAIMGALSLYLDFINMFMFLLQLLGNRE